MKHWGHVIALMCVLLATGCPGLHGKQTAVSVPAAPPTASGFTTIIPAEQLGPAWQEYGGALLTKCRVAPDARYALIELSDTESSTQYWYDRPQGTLTSLPADTNPLCFEWESRTAYRLDSDPDSGVLVEACSMPYGKWRTELCGEDFGFESYIPMGGVVTGITAAGSADCAYFLLVMAHFDETLTDPTDAEQRRRFYPVIARLSNGKVDGTPLELPDFKLKASSRVRLIASKHGVLLMADSDLYSIDIDGGTCERTGVEGVDAYELLVADNSNPDYAWGYYGIQGSDGSPVDDPDAPARFHVCQLNLKESTVLDIPIKSFVYKQISGSTDPTRCLVAHNKIGVQIVSDVGDIRWLLKTTDYMPVVLAGESEVWAATPEGIKAIAVDSLLDLAPRLAAPQAVPKEHAPELEAACTALGWEWDYVQVSPFTDPAERLLLFDCNHLSTSDEMEWNVVDHRAEAVNILDWLPSKDSQMLRGLDEEESDQYYSKLLATLGWPNSEKLFSESEDRPGDRWSLEPVIDNEPSGGTCTFNFFKGGRSIFLWTDGVLERYSAQDDLPGMNYLAPPLTTAAR